MCYCDTALFGPGKSTEASFDCKVKSVTLDLRLANNTVSYLVPFPGHHKELVTYQAGVFSLVFFHELPTGSSRSRFTKLLLKQPIYDSSDEWIVGFWRTVMTPFPPQ